MSFLFIRDHDGSEDVIAMAWHQNQRAQIEARRRGLAKPDAACMAAAAKSVNEDASDELAQWLRSQGTDPFAKAFAELGRPVLATAFLFAACFAVGVASTMT